MQRYSSLYVAAGSAYTYKGPTGERSGQVWSVYGTYANTVADPFTADTLHLCAVPEGAKLIGFSAVLSADGDTDNDFTFNLGFTGALTGFLSASTGLQATTAVAPTEAALMLVAGAPGDGAELLLTRQAGELEAACTLTFLATFTLP